MHVPRCGISKRTEAGPRPREPACQPQAWDIMAFSHPLEITMVAWLPYCFPDGLVKWEDAVSVLSKLRDDDRQADARPQPMKCLSRSYPSSLLSNIMSESDPESSLAFPGKVSVRELVSHLRSRGQTRCEATRACAESTIPRCTCPPLAIKGPWETGTSSEDQPARLLIRRASCSALGTQLSLAMHPYPAHSTYPQTAMARLC